MFTATNRRRFLQRAAAGGAFFGLGDLAFMSKLPPVSAAETKLKPNMVQLHSEIEPLVQLLEKTPRNQLLERVARKIRKGTSYREVLAALLLAGVRNIEPRPSVGFKFHAVLVVNSAHLASLSSPDSDRWLPIFWALDYYKSKQIEEEKRSGWKLPAVDESAVPSARNARKMFIHAMENWDDEAADAAIAGLVRTAGAEEVFELLFRYGARDYRSIGHKAIYVANSQRTLGIIGWRHAEPVLRSLTYALLNHNNEPNPSNSDLEADRPGRRNQELVKTIRAGWQDGQADSEAVRDMLAVLREGSSNDACGEAVKLLNNGTSPQSVWDAVLVGSGELLMRQPGIIGLHTLTTANALHYAYLTSGNDATRRMLLLQNCAFLPMFRKSAAGRGKLNDRTIDDVKPIALKQSTPAGAVEEIFADVSRNRMTAAGKIRSFLNSDGQAEQVIDAARRLIFLKGSDAHDYKYSSAVLEDYYHVSPAWRNRFLALSVFNLKGSGGRDNQVVQRTREALKG